MIIPIASGKGGTGKARVERIDFLKHAVTLVPVLEK
jgi:MinD superfamily P-loop ATPase